MSGWPDIRMTGTPNRSAIGTRSRVEPAGKRAVQQHRIDPAGAQTFHRGGRGPGAAGPIGAVERVHHHLGHERVVLDDKDVRLVGHCNLDSLTASSHVPVRLLT